jgi:hypothetical protein
VRIHNVKSQARNVIPGALDVTFVGNHYDAVRKIWDKATAEAQGKIQILFHSH